MSAFCGPQLWASKEDLSRGWRSGSRALVAHAAPRRSQQWFASGRHMIAMQGCNTGNQTSSSIWQFGAPQDLNFYFPFPLSRYGDGDLGRSEQPGERGQQLLPHASHITIHPVKNAVPRQRLAEPSWRDLSQGYACDPGFLAEGQFVRILVPRPVHFPPRIHMQYATGSSSFGTTPGIEQLV